MKADHIPARRTPPSRSSNTAATHAPIAAPRTSGSRSARSVRRPDALSLLSSASRRRRAPCCAAELVERTEDPKSFCDAHVKLMTRSETLTEDDVNAVARDLGVSADCSPSDNPPLVDADKASAAASRAIVAPTFCINGRRYDGPWHESALSDAMPGTLGHRVRSAARFRHLGTLCGRRFRGRQDRGIYRAVPGCLIGVILLSLEARRAPVKAIARRRRSRQRSVSACADRRAAQREPQREEAFDHEPCHLHPRRARRRMGL